jgi:hypothetical protein
MGRIEVGTIEEEIAAVASKRGYTLETLAFKLEELGYDIEDTLAVMQGDLRACPELVAILDRVLDLSGEEQERISWAVREQAIASVHASDWFQASCKAQKPVSR